MVIDCCGFWVAENLEVEKECMRVRLKLGVEEDDAGRY